MRIFCIFSNFISPILCMAIHYFNMTRDTRLMIKRQYVCFEPENSKRTKIITLCYKYHYTDILTKEWKLLLHNATYGPIFHKASHKIAHWPLFVKSFVAVTLYCILVSIWSIIAICRGHVSKCTRWRCKSCNRRHHAVLHKLPFWTFSSYLILPSPTYVPNQRELCFAEVVLWKAFVEFVHW